MIPASTNTIAEKISQFERSTRDLPFLTMPAQVALDLFVLPEQHRR
jgi:hypothetical protein